MTVETETTPVSDEMEEERQRILAGMMEMPDPRLEPGTLKVRDIIHKGDEEYPAPVVASTLTSAGYVYIYDTKTGERSLTNRNMLPAQLAKRREDGSFVFTQNKPARVPKRGTYKCLLHKDDPNRALYDQWGLAVCPKSNLISEHQVKRHMQNRHKVEWQTIEDARIERERQEDRALQRAFMKTVAGGTGKKN